MEHTVQPYNWRIGFRNASRKSRFSMYILGLLGLSTLVLNAISLMDREPENHIEKLKPLVASLEQMPLGIPGHSSPPASEIKSQVTPLEPKPHPKTTPNPQPPTTHQMVDEAAAPQSNAPAETEFSEPQSKVAIASSGTDQNTLNQNGGTSVGTSGSDTGSNGSQWGTQQTALTARSPMHFRKINGTNPIWVAETEVTQRQWVTLMGLDLSVVSGHWDQAVDGISWCKALEYANRLSKHEKRKPVYRFKGKCEQGGRVIWDTQADGYRLLHEDEWQSLARVSQKENIRSYTNNRGVGQVYTNQSPQKDGIYGLQSNAAEWVWGTADEVHKIQNSAVAARKCIEDGCRLENTPSERPLGIGIRLARGALIANPSSDI